ncbi:hypothetical protein [Cryobacterium sp. Y11]|uniref:hypothetical protein n=1 Tax=Cryobacterium sp. Y11 TaxID=2045016 RepID=UPI001E34D569|nr:hypothetical protein [Cryobacterium sp. Y11]
MWWYWICDTQTGDKIQRLPDPVSGPWSCSLDGGDYGSTVFQLGADDFTQAQWWDFTAPHSRTLIVERNKVIRYAGIINADPDFDHDTGRLTVAHVDLESFFSERYPFGIGSYWADEVAHRPGKIELSGRSHRSIICNVIAAGLVGPTSNYALPVVLPWLTESGSQSLTAENFNFQTCSDLISDRRKVESGVDFYFKPRWKSDTAFEWVVVAGSDSDPLLIGKTADFYLNAEQPVLSNVKFGRDGVKQFTGMFSIGQGSGADMSVGGIPSGAGLPPVIPARDTQQKIDNEANQNVLAGMSLEAARVRYSPTFQWAFTLQASTEAAPVESIELGDILRVYVESSPYIPVGWHSLRVVTLTGDEGEWVTPTVQMIGEVA